jgi:hypothetical protein
MSRFLTDIQKAPFLLTSDHPEQYFETVDNALKNGYDELNKLNIDANFIIRDTFMSGRNIDLIQRWLIKEIYKHTKILIPYQKIEHIMPVMNSVYDLYGQNLPFQLKEQIYELDYKVVSILVDTIIPEMVSRMRYIDAIESAPFIEQPIYVGSKGQRALPSTMSSI